MKLDQVEELAQNLPVIKGDLIRMKVITNELRINASQLSDGLRGVKRDLLNMLTKCDHSECKEILQKYNVGTLDANGFDYNKVCKKSGTFKGEWDSRETYRLFYQISFINKYLNILNFFHAKSFINLM